MTGIRKLIGRCKTTLWADMAHVDPNPYELELIAVDGCKADDVMIAAAGPITNMVLALIFAGMLVGILLARIAADLRLHGGLVDLGVARIQGQPGHLAAGGPEAGGEAPRLA